MNVVVDDRELLRQYVEDRSESAFSEIVNRHLNLVHATALRLVGDSHKAEDVAQSVFILLARKATSIREGNALPGWLYRATCGVAKDILRVEHRRRERESAAMIEADIEDRESSQSVWRSVVPLLEEAMQQLTEGEQNAVVLRFFESKSLSEVGRALEISEDAAQKRVSRALEKLRTHLGQRGLALSLTTLASTLAIPAAHAAPSGLTMAIAPTAIQAGNKIAISSPPGVASQVKVWLAIGAITIVSTFIVFVVRRAASNRIGSSGAKFRGVGDLPGGEFTSYANSISGDGRVVVGMSRTTNG